MCYYIADRVKCMHTNVTHTVQHYSMATQSGVANRGTVFFFVFLGGSSYHAQLFVYIDI